MPTPLPPADTDVAEPSTESVEVLVEVTDTVSVPYTTGLQRVTRELLARLPRTGSPAFHPVRWSTACGGYRELTGDEALLLADPPERLPTSTRLAARLPGPIATGVRRTLATEPVRRARAAVARRSTDRAERDRHHLCLSAPDGTGTTVLLDLEAAWNDPVPRTELLPAQRALGVRSAALVADVLPVLHPEWFDPQLLADFDTFLDGHLRHSDLLLCISERTRSDLLEVADARGVDPTTLRTAVIPLGADLGPDDGAPLHRRFADVPERYLLQVGTLEPRKNQDTALDVLEAIAPERPDVALVLVGKRGWHVDQLVRRIERHPLSGRQLFWFEEVDDDQLAALYRHATVSLTPARYEGLGVPVMEALHCGTPVVASTGGALPEAGGSAAEYVDPDDTRGWVRLVTRLLDDPAELDRARRRARAWQAPTWDAAAAGVRDAIAEVFVP
ncbi:MAG: glycosyltransferase family 4 protein [Microthrixaceae bacterium]